jgi:hypothetical protein
MPRTLYSVLYYIVVSTNNVREKVRTRIPTEYYWTSELVEVVNKTYSVMNL